MPSSDLAGARSRGGGKRNSRGFSYLFVLVLVAVLGMTAAAAGTVWSATVQREREQQLLWVARQYLRAIESYHLNGPGGARGYPRSISDLLEDRRGPILMRHLRRAYDDPMLPGTPLQLERLPDGSIIGLRSSSRAKPFKQKGFPPGMENLEGADCYCDWVFTYAAVRSAL
ncbi:MAG: hypothetical protein R3E77_14720 [Steroidobacteraceae bacterium]